jgi:transcription elongation GreA/GreB family factor
VRDKTQKFIQLAESRVNRAIKDIRLIGNLSNKNAYSYSKDDVKRIFRAIQKEIEIAKIRFEGDTDKSNQSFKLKG